MTSLKNALIINHRIKYRNVSPAKGYDMLTQETIREAVLYASGGGRYSDKEVDSTLTERDLALERMKPAAGQVSEMLDYAARSGRHVDRSPELPMRKGETSGAIWNAEGVCLRSEVERDILASGSNVVQTVVTVPREWAPTLRLVTKGDWQALIRSTWSEFMDGWGIIPPHHQRWCAFFHTDNRVNVHVHVFSWDASGQYFTGDMRIPKDRIETSKMVIRRAVFKEISFVRSIEKSYTREAVLYQTRQAVGMKQSFVDAERVNALAKRANAAFDPLSDDASRRLRRPLEKLMCRAADSLPESGTGRVGYSSVGEDARVAANLAVRELKKSPSIAALASRWSALVEMGADVLGLHGRAREEYIKRELMDLDRRMANVFLKKARDMNLPWKRDVFLSEERSDLLRRGTMAIPRDLIRRGGMQIAKNGDLPYRTCVWMGYRTLACDPIKSAVSRYADNVVKYAVANRSRPLTDEQRERLERRTRSDLSRGLAEPIRSACFRSAARRASSKCIAAVEREIFANRSKRQIRSFSTVLCAKDRAALSGSLDSIKRNLLIRSPTDETAMRRAEEILLGVPEVRSSLSQMQRTAFFERGQSALVSQNEIIRACITVQIEKEIMLERAYKANAYCRAIDSILRAVLQRGEEGDIARFQAPSKRRPHGLCRHLDVRLERSTNL